MATAVVSHRFVFGVKSGVAGNVNFLDEQTVIYPAGSNCILYHLDQKSQRFILGSDKSQGMSAIAVSPNRRYIAIAERSDKPIITIYDLHTLKRRKVLNAADYGFTEFISLAFSPDSKYLASQGGKPDWTLLYWTWEKSKVMATTKTTNQHGAPVYQVTFSPQDNTQLCVNGNGIFKLFRYSEGNLKQFAFLKMEPHNYICQSWVTEDKVIVGTDNGRLFLFEAGELKNEFTLTTSGSDYKSRLAIDQASDSKNEDKSRINDIVTYEKGFICCNASGATYIFEKGEEKDFYRKLKEVRLPYDNQHSDAPDSGIPEIKTLALSPSEEILICSTSDNQLYTVPVSTADMTKGDMPRFDVLTFPFHRDAITGMDTCIRKPLIATCSMDKSVRIWNFESGMLELHKDFQEEAFSVAIHPSGLYILVGFSDKLRLMNLLIDDIRTFREFTIRGCRECSFSNGGHLFAAVHGNVIQVYSTTTFDNVTNLKGHNGKVRSVRWSADDGSIISCGMDGAVYEWSVFTSKREGESVLKSCSYTDVTVSPEGKNIYAVGTDHTLKEICDSQILRDIHAGEAIFTQVAISHSGKMLFTGTSIGTIRSIKYPLTTTGEWQEFQAHSLGVTKLRLSYDDQYLFSVSEDGSFYVFKISEKEGRGLKRDKEVTFAEEILITKSDLEEKNAMMTELKTRVDELKMENEYQLRLKDMNYNEKIRELTEKFIQEMESLKTKNQVLKTEKDKEETRHEEQVNDVLEDHSKELQDLESANNQKLMSEYEKYQELQAKSQKMQEEYERQLNEMDESKEVALQDLTEYYENKLQEKSSQLEQANEEQQQLTREYDETKRQVEEDVDREIVDIKNKYERRLRDEKEANLRLKGETGIMRKKFTSLQKEIDEHKEEIKKLQGERVKLQNIIKSLEKDISGLKKEIQERDETIQDKEKRIYDLKKKNQELEKFKFVLDYKIKELKKQIEPRENDIKAMKEQIQEMESELERFHKQNVNLELNISELRLKLKATDKELRIARQKVRDSEALLKKFKVDLHDCVRYIQDPKKLKFSIENLYDKYVQNDTPEAANIDNDIQREYARQREHLERSVSSLRKKLTKDSEIHRADNVKIMQENVALIREINDLRRELKLAKGQVNDLEAALGVRKGTGVELLATQAHQTMANKNKAITREEDLKIIEMQKAEIAKLRIQIQEIEEHIAVRPPSNGHLPPVTAQ